MRTTYKKMVEQTITKYSCDFCSVSTENNRGCCGYAPIMSCPICRKDMCSKHRTTYQEDPSSDYPDAVVCVDCNKTFEAAWNWAEENAGRCEGLVDVALRKMREDHNAEEK